MTTQPQQTVLALALVGILSVGCASPRNASAEARDVPVSGTATASPSTPADTDSEMSFEESLYFEDDVVATPVNDPLEGLNRVIFGFNDVTYRYVLSPVGQAYTAVAPDPVEKGIGNFFHNLGMPVRSISALLQGKFDQSGREVRNFVVDSTVGLAGLMRPSAEVFDPIPPEDLGQAFASWGIGNGPFLVLPIIGPSTARDGIGQVGEWFLDPVYYLEDFQSRLAFYSTDLVNKLPSRTRRYEELNNASLDPYVAMRDAYLQYRQRAVEE